MQYSSLLLSLVVSATAYQYNLLTVPASCLSTSTKPNTVTITDTITSTYCPVCDEARTNGAVFTTTYATVYSSVCPTGLSPVTYTITQECTGTTPINTNTPPPGFTTTVVECNACQHPATATATGGVPSVTITVPFPSTSAVYNPPAVQTTITTTQPNGEVTVYVASGSAQPQPSATPVTQYSGTTSAPALYTGAASFNAVGVSAAIGVGSVFFAMLAL